MIQYLDLLKNVFDNGIIKTDRTGVEKNHFSGGKWDLI